MSQRSRTKNKKHKRLLLLLGEVVEDKEAEEEVCSVKEEGEEGAGKEDTVCVVVADTEESYDRQNKNLKIKATQTQNKMHK